MAKDGRGRLWWQDDPVLLQAPTVAERASSGNESDMRSVLIDVDIA